MNYFVSASSSTDEGFVPNTEYARKTLKFNGGYKLSENLKTLRFLMLILEELIANVR
jgi:hypothetical protein